MIELTEPAVCYRWWTVTGCGELRSASASTHAWNPGVNVALCDPPFGAVGCKRTVPNAFCGCGLHAYARAPAATPEHLVRECSNELPFRLVQATSGADLPPVVVGAVLLWGRMLSGGTCVRASHGEVLALVGTHASSSAKFYGVPSVKADALRDVALEHGRELSDETVEQLKAECCAGHHDPYPRIPKITGVASPVYYTTPGTLPTLPGPGDLL